MIVVDTSVWINHFRNDLTQSVRYLRSLDRPSEVLTGDLVLLEVLQGARDDRHSKQLETVLRAFPVVPMMSEPVAVEAARIYRVLRGDGFTIRKTVDLIIATFCILNGHALVQDDRDFRPIAERFDLRLLAI
ncbi:MAG: PIN domain nuclease [Rhizobiaceae bacterium]|nr:PIN domain nuclease [Rhizobiaceae bacterium]